MTTTEHDKKLEQIITAVSGAQTLAEKKKGSEQWFAWYDSFLETVEGTGHDAEDDALRHELLCVAVAQALPEDQQENLLNRYCIERQAELKETEANLEKLRELAWSDPDCADETLFALSDEDLVVSSWRIALLMLTEAMRPCERLRPTIEAMLQRKDIGFRLSACKLLGNMRENAWASWPAMRAFLRVDSNGPQLAAAIRYSLAAESTRSTRLRDIAEALRDDTDQSRASLLQILGDEAELGDEIRKLMKK